MNFSNLIDETSNVLASKLGCGKDAATEMVEKLVFNTECDLYSFFKSVLSSEQS